MTFDPTRSEPPLVVFDANVFDRFVSGRDPAAVAFRELLDARRVRLAVPPGIAAELSGAPAEVRSLLQLALPLARGRRTARQEVDRIRIRAIMRGDGRPGKHDSDAAHLSDAADGGCDAFVTGDGKVLRRRETLAAALPATFRIVTLEEVVAALPREGITPDALQPLDDDGWPDGP